MRTGRVDRARIAAFVERAPWTGAEWRRELLEAGLLIELGEGPAEPLRGIQQALVRLVRAEDAVAGLGGPAPWSVGEVPPAAWGVIVAVVGGMTAVWNVAVGLGGGAIVLGALALLGLVQHARMAAAGRRALTAARAARVAAQADLAERVRALRAEDFPVVTAGVRVEG